MMQAVTELTELGLEAVEGVGPANRSGVDDGYMVNTLCRDAADAHRATWPARADEYGPFRQWLEFADTRSAADYAAAHATRLEYAGKIAGLFEEIDLLACPAMPYAAPADR